MAVTAYFLKQMHADHRRYNLAERGLDRDKAAGLKEVREIIRDIDGDLHRGGPAADNGFPSSEDVPRSLRARPEPDS
jgi:hypothetical protein